MARHVRKGDMVMVITGSDRAGRNNVGRVLRVLPDNRVVVEGMNVRKKHVRPSAQQQQGGIIEKEMPINISNVVPVVDGKPTRVRFQKRADGSKVRIAARSDTVIGPELKKATNQ